MASSAMSVLSGIAAAAAGLAGEKVSKTTGAIPGLDLATIVPALLGSKAGTGGIVGKIASAATAVAKSGLINSSTISKLGDAAGSLISLSKKTGAKDTASAVDGISALAAAIVGGTGKATGLASIATMAAKLAKTAKDNKALAGIATNLGKTLSSKFGVSFNGAGTAITALGKVLEGDTKTALFQAILKGLV
jgi:hypothetical protein